jgi:hypothetical protein
VGSEPSTVVQVFIAKTIGTLANPVLFRVIPLTVQEAETRGIVNFTRPPDDNTSPSIAGLCILCS